MFISYARKEAFPANVQKLCSSDLHAKDPTAALNEVKLIETSLCLRHSSQNIQVFLLGRSYGFWIRSTTANVEKRSDIFKPRVRAGTRPVNDQQYFR